MGNARAKGEGRGHKPYHRGTSPFMCLVFSKNRWGSPRLENIKALFEAVAMIFPRKEIALAIEGALGNEKVSELIAEFTGGFTPDVSARNVQYINRGAAAWLPGKRKLLEFLCAVAGVTCNMNQTPVLVCPDCDVPNVLTKPKLLRALCGDGTRRSGKHWRITCKLDCRGCPSCNNRYSIAITPYTNMNYYNYTGEKMKKGTDTCSLCGNDFIFGVRPAGVTDFLFQRRNFCPSDRPSLGSIK